MIGLFERRLTLQDWLSELLVMERNYAVIRLQIYDTLKVELKKHL